MRARKFFVCLLFAAIVATPLTASDTKKHRKQGKKRVSKFDATHVLQRNGTKDIQHVVFGHSKYPHFEGDELPQARFPQGLTSPWTASDFERYRRQGKKRVSKFDPTHILEKNRTKHIQYVELDHSNYPYLEDYGVPQARSPQGFLKDLPSPAILVKTPEVKLMIHSHDDNFDNSEFNKDKCRGIEFKNNEKQKFRCHPRETIVHLIHQNGLILSPAAVAVKRCDGACNVHSKCVADKTSNHTFFIRQFQNNQATCGSIQVEEHLSCKCSCPERASHCLPNQIYDQDECKCKCPSNVKTTCPNKKFFNESECGCKCKNKNRKCSTGSYFDEEKCSCPRP